ncbi:MAG: phosphoglycerate kinase, partial [Dehalococcoidia bacterium]
MKLVSDVDVRGKRVLVRVDFNVPLHPATGDIADDSRIRASLRTINYLVEQGARVILCSHLGRPDGKIVDGLRLAPIAVRLSQLLSRPVAALAESVGPQVEKRVGDLGPGGVLMLENIRFHPGEEVNDPALAQALARLADIFVNDGFGVSHRAHASTVGVARLLPSVAGLLLEKEVSALGQLLSQPGRPFAAILGGAKVKDKIGVLENLLHRVDKLLIGGGMAATFLRAQGVAVGTSGIEADRIDLVGGILDQAQERGVAAFLPQDVVVAPSPPDPTA